jgi:hypothetical protein
MDLNMLALLLMPPWSRTTVEPFFFGTRAHVGWPFKEIVVTFVMVGVTQDRVVRAVVLIRARVRG